MGELGNNIPENILNVPIIFGGVDKIDSFSVRPLGYLFGFLVTENLISVDREGHTYSWLKLPKSGENKKNMEFGRIIR